MLNDGIVFKINGQPTVFENQVIQFIPLNGPAGKGGIKDMRMTDNDIEFSLCQHVKKGQQYGKQGYPPGAFDQPKKRKIKAGQ